MSVGTTAEVHQRFERIVQGLATPIQQSDGRSASQPPGAGQAQEAPLGPPGSGASEEFPPAVSLPARPMGPPDVLGMGAGTSSRPRSLPPDIGIIQEPSGSSQPSRPPLTLVPGGLAAAAAANVQVRAPSAPAPSNTSGDGAPWEAQGPGGRPPIERAPTPPGLDAGGPPGDGDDNTPQRLRKHKSSGGLLVDVDSTMRLFPPMFTFFCLATFCMPIWITYHIGNDENVKQWISTKIWAVLLLFIPYAITHLIHYMKGHPVRIALVVCLVGSSVVLLLIGDYILLQAYKKGNAFAARDCDTFPEKRALEVEWQKARTFYANCAAKKASAFNLTFTQAVMQYRIESCTEYKSLVATEHPDWHYLGFLEETYRCSGWCQEGEPIWTFASTSDACSSAVADVLFNKIQWSTMQVVIYTIVVLGFVSTTLITIGPILIKLGIQW